MLAYTQYTLFITELLLNAFKNKTFIIYIFRIYLFMYYLS